MDQLQQILVILVQLQSDVSEIKTQLRATSWVSGKVLAQQLKKRDRWPEVWRNAGLFSIEGGQVRNIGTAKQPRYEYHVERCRYQWDLWCRLDADAKKLFRKQ